MRKKNFVIESFFCWRELSDYPPSADDPWRGGLQNKACFAGYMFYAFNGRNKFRCLSDYPPSAADPCWGGLQNKACVADFMFYSLNRRNKFRCFIYKT